MIWRGDNVLAPVSPSESEAESRVNEASSVAGETGGVRNPSSHLAESGHDHVDNETDRGVCNENRGRAAIISDVQVGAKY